MSRIYKYAVPIQNSFEVPMPEGARVLTVQMQNGRPQIWAIVDPEAQPISRRFHLAATGLPLPEGIDSFSYIGTFQAQLGEFIFHLFEIQS